MGAFDEVAPLLEHEFTMVGYDRRGRGDSGAGSSPYAVQHEVDDPVAVLGAVGTDASVFGMSSGAALCLEVARQGALSGRLAVYEPPFILDSSHPPDDPGFTDTLRALLAKGRRTRAVQAFLRLLGVPAPVVVVMPLLPM